VTRQHEFLSSLAQGGQVEPLNVHCVHPPAEFWVNTRTWDRPNRPFHAKFYPKMRMQGRYGWRYFRSLPGGELEECQSPIYWWRPSRSLWVL